MIQPTNSQVVSRIIAEMSKRDPIAWIDHAHLIAFPGGYYQCELLTVALEVLSEELLSCPTGLL